MSEINFGAMMEGVARELWGDHNPKMSTPKKELRYGESGARSVDLEKGVWQDHRDKTGGGVLHLIKKELGLEGQEAFDWLKAKGFPIPERQQRYVQSRNDLGELVAQFSYTDEQGNELYEVCRFENGELDRESGKRKKTFRQRRREPNHPDAKGPEGLVWHLKDVRRVLYRLPEVLAAKERGEPIVLIEGEKAVKAAVSIGLCGTTNAMGAGKWEEGFSESLRDADVIICGDNDEAGRNHVQLQASSLRGIARRVRVVSLPLRSDKDDIYEWVQQGGTKEAFLAIADATPDWRPAPPQSRFGAVEWSRMDETGKEYEYRVKGLFAKYGVAMIGGESGSGKSFIAGDIGFAIARGMPYAGRKTEKGLVLYQAGEGGVGFKKRMRAYRKTHNVDEDIPFVLLPGELDLHNNDDHTNSFIAECRFWAVYYGIPIGAIFIDTFSTATPGANENDGGEVSKILARSKRIADECDTLVVIVHHMNADGKKLRGHTSIRANVDNVLLVSKLDIKDADGRWQRKCELVKNKDGEDGFSWHFVLKQVDIGADIDGDRITSCIVADVAKGGVEQQAAQKLRLTPNDEMFYRCLKAALRDYGSDAPQELSSRGIKRVVTMSAVRAELHKKWTYTDDPAVSEEDNKRRRNDVIQKALARSGDRLMRVGMIDRDLDHGLVWDLGMPRWATKAERVTEDAQGEPSNEDGQEIDLGW